MEIKKLNAKNLKEQINKQIQEAKIGNLRFPNQPYNVELSVNGKTIRNTFRGNNKYDPGKLEIIHIAMKFGMTTSKLEKSILELEDPDSIDVGKGYKYLYSVVMLHDPSFRELRKEIAEHKLKVFDKNETVTEPIIIQDIDYEDVNFDKQLAEEENQITNKFKEEENGI